jgi:hypothetical protein
MTMPDEDRDPHDFRRNKLKQLLHDLGVSKFDAGIWSVVTGRAEMTGTRFHDRRHFFHRS